MKKLQDENHGASKVVKKDMTWIGSMKQRYENKMKDIEHDICKNKVFEEIVEMVENVDEKSDEIKEAKPK